MSKATRSFLNVGGRVVHLRRAGRGPALVLLHGSPNSSLSLAALMESLSDAFDCIALDTPGNGNSDPLQAAAPSTADFAQVLSETVDALGLRRFSLYGFHTGAGTAAEYMVQHQERVAGAVLDGFAAWTEDEKAGMLQGYLPPFEPTWDGAHLAWLWSRVMEQSIFFPWHRPALSTRMNYDMAEPDILQRTAMEFLRAGDNYRKPYAAALAGDGAARARRIKSPTLITAHPLDPIAHHLDRLQDLDPAVKLRRFDTEDRAAIWSAFKAFLLQHPGDAVPEAAPRPAAANLGFVRTARGDLMWRGDIGGSGRPLALLHDAGGSSELFATSLKAIAARRPVIAFDLPGHGESGIDRDPCDTVEDFSAAVFEALRGLNMTQVDAAGFHLGGQIAIDLKQRGVASAAAIIGALHFDDADRRARIADYAPDLTVRWDGAHLLTAWRFIRLRTLYDPWRTRSREHIHWSEPLLDPALVHRQCVDLLKAENRHIAAYRAQFSWDTVRRMKSSAASLLMLAPSDPMSGEPRVRAFSAAFGGGLEIETLGPSPAAWGDALAMVGTKT